MKASGPALCCQTKLPATLPSHMGTTSCLRSVPLLAQLPANDMRKTAEERPSVWAHESMCEIQLSSCLLVSAWPSPGHCSHQRSEPVDAVSVCLSFSLPSYLPLLLEQITSKKKKKGSRISNHWLRNGGNNEVRICICQINYHSTPSWRELSIKICLSLCVFFQPLPKENITSHEKNALINYMTEYRKSISCK